MRLIDADALFDRVYDEYGESLDEGPANRFMNLINEAPSMWIPVFFHETTDEDDADPGIYRYIVDGTLPDNCQDILVTDGRDVWSDTFFDDDGIYLDSGNDWTDLTAWMPLPEPYKPAELEENDA